MPYSGEETNKKLGALTVITEDLVESNKNLAAAVEGQTEQEDASFFEEDDKVDGSSQSKALSVVVVDDKAAVASKVNAQGQQVDKRGKLLHGAALEARNEKIAREKEIKLDYSGIGAAGRAEEEQEKDKPEPDEKKRNSLL